MTDRDRDHLHPQPRAGVNVTRRPDVRERSAASESSFPRADPAAPARGTKGPARAVAGDVASTPDDLHQALQLVGAVLDDAPRSAYLVEQAAGDPRVTLRLASLVVGLLEGDSDDKKRDSLAALSLALQMTGVTACQG